MVGPDATRFSWVRVASWAAPIALVVIFLSALVAVDPWLPFVPREPGRRITELFLRSMLVAYFLVALLIPAGLAVSLLAVFYNRDPLRRSWSARVALLCVSAGVALIGAEITSAAWLAWIHRLPSLPTDFPPSTREEGELSFVVIGGSAALGYPYSPRLSIGQIVAWKLEEMMPGIRVELTILADLGKNLEEQHLEMTKLKRRPDLLLIHAGHNEFLSRFADSRDAGYREEPEGWILRLIYQASLRSPFCLLIYETVSKHRLGGPPPPINRHQLLDAPAFSLSEYTSIIADFRRRLSAILDYCSRLGTLPIIIISPDNESGFEPNRTVLPGRLSLAEREALERRFYEARAMERDRTVESIDRYRSLISDQPRFAEAHFRLARLLEQTGDYEQARAHYIAAKDFDGFPVRCPSELARVHREVANKYDCILIDGPEVLRPLTRHGILDDEFFHDAHHASMVCQVGLAQSILDRLRQRRDLGLMAAAGEGSEIDLAEVASRFQIDVEEWVGVCIKASTYYGHLGAARFDPTERRAKQLALQRAAARIRAGVAPERSGVPGVGVPPSPVCRWDWWNEDQEAACLP